MVIEMIKIYLASVIIYMIIIYCTIFIFNDSMKDKGWGTTAQRKVNRLTVLFCLSAVPILRVIVLASILYLATHTKEEVEKLLEEAKNNKSQGN